MDTETIRFLVAGWGAVTGTIAIGIQLKQQFADRSRLKLSATMSIQSNDKHSEEHLVFTLEVVNYGRRASRIKYAGIQLEPRMSNVVGMPMQPTAGEIKLYDAHKTGVNLELEEGGTHRFVLEPFSEKVAETFRDTEVAFVTDTRGRKYTTNFRTIRLK
jgi:hypothetical protein